MLGDHHESRITIAKDKLLETVKENREKHRTEYEAAMKGYREQVLAEAHKIVAAGDAGGKVDRTAITKLAEPPSHLKEYDKAIRMLEMSVQENIEISSRKFEELVLDEWEWTRVFKTTTSSYIGAAR